MTEVHEKNLAPFTFPEPGFVYPTNYPLYHYVRSHVGRKVLLKYLRMEGNVRHTFDLRGMMNLTQDDFPQPVRDIIHLFHTYPAPSADVLNAASTAHYQPVQLIS